MNTDSRRDLNRLLALGDEILQQLKVVVDVSDEEIYTCQGRVSPSSRPSASTRKEPKRRILTGAGGTAVDKT
jgi:hypothetical protein